MTFIILIAACAAVAVAFYVGYVAGFRSQLQTTADWQAACRRAERAAEMWRRCAAEDVAQRRGIDGVRNRG